MLFLSIKLLLLLLPVMVLFYFFRPQIMWFLRIFFSPWLPFYYIGILASRLCRWFNVFEIINGVLYLMHTVIGDIISLTFLNRWTYPTVDLLEKRRVQIGVKLLQLICPLLWGLLDLLYLSLFYLWVVLVDGVIYFNFDRL